MFWPTDPTVTTPTYHVFQCLWHSSSVYVVCMPMFLSRKPAAGAPLTMSPSGGKKFETFLLCWLEPSLTCAKSNQLPPAWLWMKPRPKTTVLIEIWLNHVESVWCRI